MAVRYTIRNVLTAGNPSPARRLTATLIKLAEELSRKDGVITLAWQEKTGRKTAERPSVLGARKLLKRLFSEGKTERVLVSRGPLTLAVKAVEDSERPVPDGAGTTPIDKIHAAVHAFCDAKGWDITEMGICAAKPGEHGHCNAWDGGVLRENGKLLPSEEIHRRLGVVASFIRDEGIKHDRTNGREGLPVNGVIFMDKYWETGLGLVWRPYTGTKHVTHWHVSGKPSITGWV